MLHRGLPHRSAVAVKVLDLADQAHRCCPGQPHRAHRFLRRAAIRPSHTANSHRKARATIGLRPAHHGLDHRLTHRANSSEQRFRNSQLLTLLPVGIGDVARLEPSRATRNTRNRLSYATTGARFGRRHLGLEGHQLLAQFGSQLG